MITVDDGGELWAMQTRWKGLYSPALAFTCLPANVQIYSISKRGLQTAIWGQWLQGKTYESQEMLVCVGNMKTAWGPKSSRAKRRDINWAVSNLWRTFANLFGDKPKLEMLQIFWPPKMWTPIALFSWEVLIQLFSNDSSCP